MFGYLRLFKKTIIDLDNYNLNKYFKKVNNSNQPGIAEIVYDAFKKGRAAIVAGDYTLRDAQANIIKINLSKVVGYKAVDYLNGYMDKMGAGNTADAFHALSEGYGFIMSLQFTNDGNESPYFSKSPTFKRPIPCSAETDPPRSFILS